MVQGPSSGPAWIHRSQWPPVPWSDHCTLHWVEGGAVNFEKSCKTGLLFPLPTRKPVCDFLSPQISDPGLDMVCQ